MALTRIGTTTEVSVQSSPTNTSVPSGQFQMAAVTAKGPLNYSVIIRSLEQYTDVFGGRTPFETGYDTARLFFQEGGAELIVTRVVGPNATNGSVTLTNGAATPVDVLTVQVIDPGAHSADYQAIVSVNADTTFNLSVVDTTSGRIIAQFTRAESAADLVSLALGNEAVVITDLGSGLLPAAGAFNLTAGSDDRAGITAATYLTALNNHKGVRTGVAVGTPGQPANVISAALGEHCATRGKIGIPEVPAGYTIAQAKALGDALIGTAYAAHLAGPVFPALRIPDGSDRSRVVSAVGYVAAKRAVIHRTTSFAQAVAGKRAAAIWNFQPTLRLSEEDINSLNESGINGIQSGSGAPFLNNWRSLSEEPARHNLNVQDALNNLDAMLRTGLSDLLWRPNEGRGVIATEATLIVAGIMSPLVEEGYLTRTLDGDGNAVDDGYTVDVEDVLTSGQAAPYNRVQVSVGVKLSPTIQHIHIPIYAADIRSSF